MLHITAVGTWGSDLQETSGRECPAFLRCTTNRGIRSRGVFLLLPSVTGGRLLLRMGDMNAPWQPAQRARQAVSHVCFQLEVSRFVYMGTGSAQALLVGHLGYPLRWASDIPTTGHACLLGMRGARTKEGGDAKDIGRKKEGKRHPLGATLPRDGAGSSWPWDWLEAGGADHIPEGHSTTCMSVDLALQLCWEHSPDASSLQG